MSGCEAIGARVQQAAGRGERVAVLAPQGIDYVAGFYAAIKAGTIAVPLFAPELPGHAERLDTALRDSQPTVDPDDLGGHTARSQSSWPTCRNFGGPR